MTPKLFIQALTKFFAGLIIVGLLLFLPAGTCAYWQAWLFIGILFVPMFIAGIWLMFSSPELLRKRLADIQTLLMNYHKDIIQLAKDLLIPIHNEISNLLTSDS